MIYTLHRKSTDSKGNMMSKSIYIYSGCIGPHGISSMDIHGEYIHCEFKYFDSNPRPKEKLISQH